MRPWDTHFEKTRTDNKSKTTLIAVLDQKLAQHNVKQNLDKKRRLKRRNGGIKTGY